MNKLNLFLKQAETIIRMQMAYDMRRRLNPHHSIEDVNYEKAMKDREQSDAFQRLKKDFIVYRDELYDAARDFPKGLEVLRIMDKIVEDEIDRVLLEE